VSAGCQVGAGCQTAPDVTPRIIPNPVRWPGLPCIACRTVRLAPIAGNQYPPNRGFTTLLNIDPKV
jgi:hypothetical protein